MNCIVCSQPTTIAHRVAWCESCMIGESLVFPGRGHQLPSNYGFREAQEYLTLSGKDIVKSRLDFLEGIGNRDSNVLDVFSGSGGTLRAMLGVYPRSLGYEPLGSTYNNGQVMLGVQERVVEKLESVPNCDLLTMFSGFTSLLRPISILALYQPSDVVIEAPIFDGSPQELPFWIHADPYEHAMIYSVEGFKKAMLQLRYNCVTAKSHGEMTAIHLKRESC